MRKLAILFIRGFIFVRCSSGSSDSKFGAGGGVTQFVQKSAGAVVQTQGLINFSYAAEAPVSGVSKVMITLPGNAPIQLAEVQYTDKVSRQGAY